MENTKLTTKQILLIILLILLILFGGFGTLCGGYFTSISLLGQFYDSYIISVPSFLFGLLFIFLGYKGIKKVSNNKICLCSLFKKNKNKNNNNSNQN